MPTHRENHNLFMSRARASPWIHSSKELEKYAIVEAEAGGFEPDLLTDMDVAIILKRGYIHFRDMASTAFSVVTARRFEYYAISTAKEGGFEPVPLTKEEKVGILKRVHNEYINIARKNDSTSCARFWERCAREIAEAGGFKAVPLTEEEVARIESRTTTSSEARFKWWSQRVQFEAVDSDLQSWIENSGLKGLTVFEGGNSSIGLA